MHYILDKVVIKKEHPQARLPEYMTSGSAGADLYAVEGTEILPGQVLAVSVGFSMALPEGYEAQIRSRSGLALNNAVCVLNSPGTIDSDFRGVLKVILANLGPDPFVIKPGDRVAQMVINRVSQAEFQEVEVLDETDRGEGGFGSTGV